MEGQEPIEQTAPEQVSSGMVREVSPDLPVSRRQLVMEWQNKVLRAKKHWDKPLKSMREDMDFFMGKQWFDGNGDKYVANLVQSHVQKRVASLYAKNPKAVAKRREKIDFAMWDGNFGRLQEAQMQVQLNQQQGLPPPSDVIALMQDIQQGMQAKSVSEKIARTLEIIFHHILEEQNIKPQMKQLVRRVCVTGVGYVKLGYHRKMGKRPDDLEKITDITEQINVLDRLIADAQDDKFTPEHAKAEQLRILLKELMEKPDAVLDEGLVFDFPLSNTIIVDPRCRQLKGFVGADWVAQEFILTIDEIKEVYGVDIGAAYTKQEDAQRLEAEQLDKSDCELARVWEIYCKRDGLKYVVADGYPEFLKEPTSPEVRLKRFWPFFVLTFNEVENDKEIYPPSDVRLLMPIQREYNLARQRLREHRNANKPLYVSPTGALSEADIDKLKNRVANEVVMLQAIQPGQAVDQVLQPVKPIPIDPTLYDTTVFMEDLYRVVGSQEANLGGTSSSTATEVSVAESSRISALSSNVDDLDDFLTDLSRSSGETLLKEMDQATAQKIAGPGAVWPTLTAQEISDNLLLEIQAGSSGRPNKAAEIANFERIAPILLQIPGIDPTFLAKEALKRMDDAMDVTEALAASMPSIVALNAQKQIATGNPMTDPNQQGGQGGNNAEGAPAAPGARPGGEVPNVPEANLRMYGQPPPPPNTPVV